MCFASGDSAIIITGGVVTGIEGYGVSVEILRENGSYWCSLPDLPDIRYTHTQSGLVACGGTPPPMSESCIFFANGEWITSHQLQMFGRYGHSAWKSQIGLVLLGGGGGKEYTTEILTEDGQSVPFFDLKYYTRLGWFTRY